MSQIGLIALCLCLTSQAAASEISVPLSPDGFIVGWQVKEQRRTVIQPGPDIDLHAGLSARALKRQQRKGTRFTLDAVLVAQRAGTLRFKMGCTKECELLVNGAPILTVSKDYRAFMDDSEVEFAVTRGRHAIQVRMHRRVRSKRHRQRLYLRVHDIQNAAPHWIHTRLNSKSSVPEALLAALPITVEKTVAARGIRVRVTVGPAGRFEAPVKFMLGLDEVETHGERIILESHFQSGESVDLTVHSGAELLQKQTIRFRTDPDLLNAVLSARAVLADSKGEADAVDTLAWGIQHVAELLAAGDKDSAYLKERAQTISRQANALSAGEDFLSAERGAQMRAYRSPLDGRLQPYAVYIPPRWRPTRALPLHVTLHPSGFSPMLSLRLAMGHPIKGGKRRSERRLPRLVSRGAIVVAPFGYRGTGSRYFGKVDVMSVIDRVQARYRTDPRRVTLSGGSLGGLGSWHIGLRSPDRFNAIVPMAGYGSARQYGDVTGVKRRPWERFLLARRDNATFVENARHLPMLCFHGDRDNPRRSEVIVNRYKKLGYRHEYELLEDTGHNAWDSGYENGRAFVWARRFRTPRSPKRVRFVSGSYRHARAYWLTIEQFDRHEALGRVKATRSKKGVKIRTENVRRLALALSPAAVQIDGQRFTKDRFSPRWKRVAGRWQAATDSIPAGEKSPGLSGPIDDIRYEPHVFVYGTADPAQTEVNRRRAEHAARYFWNSSEIHMPVVADHAFDRAQMQEKHLVLIGNPKSNKILASMAKQLPVTWESDAIRVGKRRFMGKSVGISFIYPNPLAPHRYLLVHAGVGRRGTWLSAWLPRWLPDFMVYDDAVSVQRGGRLMDKREALWAGYFDRQWRLPDSEL
jgi:predicted peptidase